MNPTIVTVPSYIRPGFTYSPLNNPTQQTNTNNVRYVHTPHGQGWFSAFFLQFCQLRKKYAYYWPIEEKICLSFPGEGGGANRKIYTPTHGKSILGPG